MSNPNDTLALFGDGNPQPTEPYTPKPKPKPARTPGPWSEGWDYVENDGYFILARDTDGNDFPIVEVLQHDIFEGRIRTADDGKHELPANANMEYIVLACNHFEALLAVCETHLSLRARTMKGDLSNDLQFRFQQNGRDMEAVVKAVKDAQGLEPDTTNRV